MPSRKLLVCFAVLSICGCAKNADNSDNRLSDAELLKLNIQCRESADQVAEKKYMLVKGEMYVHWTLKSAKYSREYRRCIAHFSMSEMIKNFSTIYGEYFIDPVSGSEFASRTGAREDGLDDVYQIAGGGLDGPTQLVNRDEYLQFTANLMATP